MAGAVRGTRVEGGVGGEEIMSTYVLDAENTIIRNYCFLLY